MSAPKKTECHKDCQHEPNECHEREYNDSDESHPYYLDADDGLNDNGHDCGCGHHHNHEHGHDHENAHEHDHSCEHHNHGHTHNYEQDHEHGHDQDHDCESHPGDAESKAVVSEMISFLTEFEELSKGAAYGDFMKNKSLHEHLTSLLAKVQAKALALDPDFISRNPKVDWNSLQTIETQVVHPTYGLNPETLWDLIRLDVPFLNRRLDVVVNGCCHNH
ncbi:hypothetical protein MsAg5_00790 [Methanosarcinaceae archaeon Ag5]|uniref:DUF86 domain-containing protein n=1 Tax=Methanolapillus africanus TaxID=3028297 RepID=A0AAE4MHT8_9EURY|nr:hypothetical protein [Methanosarcinaceae archaeon Ag5]